MFQGQVKILYGFKDEFSFYRVEQQAKKNSLNILNLEIGNRNKISTQLITWGEIKTILRVLDYRIEMVLTEHSCVAILATSIASSLTSLIILRFGLDFPVSAPTSAKGKMEKY